MKFILAEKQTMTQIYAANGSVVPVTRVTAGPCVVTQIKNQDRDGYTALQVGFGQRKHVSKPVLGHVKDLGKFAYLREFRVEPAAATVAVGDKISAGVFAVGDIISATGVSKGKGFQGVVKRWGFHGSPKSHGHKDQLRMPGSSGAGGVQHVLKGKKMGGRMGGDQITVKNLEIVAVDPEKNELLIKGAIPGAVGGLIVLAGEGVLEVNLAPVEPAKEEMTEEVTENSESTETEVAEKEAPEAPVEEVAVAPEAPTPTESTPESETPSA
jgi:large subunit ribosomal protein L3